MTLALDPSGEYLTQKSLQAQVGIRLRRSNLNISSEEPRKEDILSIISWTNNSYTNIIYIYIIAAHHNSKYSVTDSRDQNLYQEFLVSLNFLKINTPKEFDLSQNKNNI